MRNKVCLLLLAVCSLLSLVNLCRATLPRGNWSLGDDAVTRHEQRFEKLRSALPPDVTTVGYVSDPPIMRGDVVAGKEYVLTLYALAPVVVDLTPEHHYVVGNSTTMDHRLPDTPHLIIERDFGAGVFLFRRDDR